MPSPINSPFHWLPKNYKSIPIHLFWHWTSARPTRSNILGKSSFFYIFYHFGRHPQVEPFFWEVCSPPDFWKIFDFPPRSEKTPIFTYPQRFGPNTPMAIYGHIHGCISIYIFVYRYVVGPPQPIVTGRWTIRVLISTTNRLIPLKFSTFIVTAHINNCISFQLLQFVISWEI